MKKKALIFGVTGQDGAYLSEFLLRKNYEVHGVIRRSSSINTRRLDHLYQDPHVKNRNFILHYGDITDSTSVSKIIESIRPKEIYNLYGIPYFIKIDIEGCDMDILQSLKYLNYENRPKYLSLESSRTSWNALMKEFDLLKKLGYLNFQAIPQSKNAKKITKWKDAKGKIISYHHEKHSSGPFGVDLSYSWKDLKEIKRIYKFIFTRYFLFGDDGIFAPRKIKTRILRGIFRRILSLFGLSPNWFDTHAKKD